MLHEWLILNVLLLDSDWDLLRDLGLDHFDEEFLVLGIHSASTLATTAWVRSALLRLPTIAPEAGNRLCWLLLGHQLLILACKFFDLSLIFLDFRGLFADYWCQTSQHSSQLGAILSQFTLFLGHLSGWVWLDTHSAVVLHREIGHEAIVSMLRNGHIKVL